MRYMPRYRTKWTGVFMAVLTETGGTRIWCWRRDDEHQITSILGAFSCSRLAQIHDSTSSSTATDGTATRLMHSACRSRISACRRRNYVVVDHGFLSVVISLPSTVETRQKLLLCVDTRLILCYQDVQDSSPTCRKMWPKGHPLHLRWYQA